MLPNDKKSSMNSEDRLNIDLAHVRVNIRLRSWYNDLRMFTKLSIQRLTATYVVILQPSIIFIVVFASRQISLYVLRVSLKAAIV